MDILSIFSRQLIHIATSDHKYHNFLIVY